MKSFLLVDGVLKNPQAVILYREKEIEYKSNKISQAKFWTFVEEIKDCKIKVVIIQIGNGNKKFCKTPLRIRGF